MKQILIMQIEVNSDIDLSNMDTNQLANSIKDLLEVEWEAQVRITVKKDAQ